MNDHGTVLVLERHITSTQVIMMMMVIQYNRSKDNSSGQENLALISSAPFTAKKLTRD